VNELIGSIVLAGIMAVILYFVFAGKLKLGFDTTIAFTVPLLLLLGLGVGFFNPVFAFLTVFAGILLGILFNKFVGNK